MDTRPKSSGTRARARAIASAPAWTASGRWAAHSPRSPADTQRLARSRSWSKTRPDSSPQRTQPSALQKAAHSERPFDLAKTSRDIAYGNSTTVLSTWRAQPLGNKFRYNSNNLFISNALHGNAVIADPGT